MKKKTVVATTLSTLLVSTAILANAVQADEVETHAAVTAPSTEVVATEATTNATSTAATTASSESAAPVASSTSVVTASTAETSETPAATASETATAAATPTTEVVTNASTSASNDTVTVLHTNDVHGRMVEDDRNGVVGDALLSGIVNDSRSKGTTLVFDSGDSFQGLPISNSSKGEDMASVMNAVGFDAMTVGNHEFDFGLENMARMFRQAKFPVVCANYDFKNTPLDGLVKPYVVIERSGVKVGVFGLSPQLEGLVDNKNCEGVKYIDPVEATFEIVKMLRNKEKCDVVVCLSHLGWDESKDSGDKRLISSTKGIDIVLGGHSHTYFKELRYVANAEGKDVPDDQNGKHAVYVGKIILSLSK